MSGFHASRRGNHRSLSMNRGRRRETVFAAVLINLTLLLVGKSVFDLQTPLAQAPAPPEPSYRSHRTNPKGPKEKMKEDGLADPTLHDQRLQQTENRAYEGSGRNIFRSQGLVRSKRIVVPPEPPNSVVELVRPTIRLRFFGFASTPNQPRKAFLGGDDTVFIAPEGEIVDRRYRVLKIDSNWVILEDLIEKSLHRLALPG
jgi:hypothetical protein